MITAIANKVADFFVEKNIIESNEREIYIYGCEALFSALSNFIIVILCGLIMGELVNTLIFFLVFLMMRKYCGGYHARTHLKCNLIFISNVFIVLLLIKNILLINTAFLIASIIISNVLIFWLAPVENENKPLEKYEFEKYRKIAIIFSSFFTVIAVLLLFFYKTVSIIIILALLSVSLMMLAARLIKKVEVNKDES